MPLLLKSKVGLNLLLHCIHNTLSCSTMVLPKSKVELTFNYTYSKCHKYLSDGIISRFCNFLSSF
jgi:hypothetical protein